MVNERIWQYERLGNFISIVKGKKPKTMYAKPVNGALPYVLASSFESGQYDQFTDDKSCKLCDVNDVLVLWDGSKAGRVAHGLEGYIGSTIAALKIADKTILSDRFLYYVLTNHNQLISGNTAGTGIPHVQRDVVEGIPIPMIPISEQRKIAAILTSVDDAIHATQSIIDQIEVVKHGLMQRLLMTGIGHTSFKETEIGEIPTRWDLVELSQITTKVTDGTHQSPKFINEGVPFMLVSNISSGRINWDTDKYISEETYNVLTKYVKPEKGDILYSAVGATYGVAVVIDCDKRFSFQRHIAHIKPIRKRIDSQFLMCVLNSPIGKNQADRAAVGNAQQTVTLGSLSKFVIPLPSLAEQRDISNILASMDKSIEKNVRYRNGLSVLKKGLMQVLLMGKVRVNVDKLSEVSV